MRARPARIATLKQNWASLIHFDPPKRLSVGQVSPPFFQSFGFSKFSYGLWVYFECIWVFFFLHFECMKNFQTFYNIFLCLSNEFYKSNGHPQASTTSETSSHQILDCITYHKNIFDNMK